MDNLKRLKAIEAMQHRLIMSGRAFTTATNVLVSHKADLMLAMYRNREPFYAER